VLCHDYHAKKHAEGKTTLMEVLDFITAQCKTLEDLGWAGILVEVEAVRALILETLGRGTEAVKTLYSALALAKDHNFLRTFLDEGDVMKGLLQRAVKQEGHSGYAQRILAAFSVPEVVKPAWKDEPKDNLIEPLSARELQVLRLLNTRLSVPEIAAELFLAPSTVRSHVQRIYQKFGVHSRLEALQRAGELELL
jgi:LuxR family maltose regulon positive regulatory protein